MSLKARIIKSEKCTRCARYLERLDKLGFKYLIYDADKADEEGKKMLDTWRVADMPIIQIVDDDGKIHYQFPFVDQGMSPRSINHMISQKEKDLKKIP
jgi:hypothetical protein